jgi:hypothetical protein
VICAMLSQSRGIAIVDDESTLLRLDAHAPRSPAPIGLAAAAALLHGAPDLETVHAVDLEAISRHLEWRDRRERLLTATLWLVDPVAPEPVWRAAALDWVDAWDEPSQRWVEGILLSRVAPEGVDLSRIGDRLGDRAPDWTWIQDSQARIARVCIAWETIPDAAFGEIPRATLRAAAVREGAFRAMVLGKDIESEQLPPSLIRVRLYPCHATSLPADAAYHA